MDKSTEDLTENVSVSAAKMSDSVSDELLEPDSAVELNSAEMDTISGGSVSTDDNGFVDDAETEGVALSGDVKVWNDAVDNAAIVSEMKDIQENLQNSLSHIQYVSSRVDAVSNDVEELSRRVTGISGILDGLAQEMEGGATSTGTKKVLSRTFLAVSSIVLVLLVAFQIYMFVSLLGLQRLQNATGTSLMQNVGSLNKRLADFDAKFAKAMEKAVQQEQAQQKVVAMQPGVGESGSEFGLPVTERLNRLRNGLPEKRLIRKESGDWFVYGKKGNESISDMEIIKALNEAYTKFGRSLATKIPLPPHNSLCVLKPDGKGGTLVVMTDKFLP